MIAIEVLAGWGVTGAALIGHVFVANYRIGANEKSLDNVWKWKTSHEKDANDMREKYQIQLSELKGSQLVVGEQFKQIMAILTEIKMRLETLENRK